MNTDLKVILLAIGATIAIIVGGIFLSSKGGGSNSQTVNQDLLVKEDSVKIQAPDEKAVLVEFGDFQCPACATYHLFVKQLLVDFGDNLTFVFRNFPLSQHANAKPSSYAAEAAGLQGKYWEMYDYLYENQEKWSGLSDPKPFFIDHAKTLDLDVAKFEADMEDSGIKAKVDNDYGDGVALRIDSTPTFYLNGTKMNVPANYEAFKKAVSDAISKSSSQ